MRSSVTLVILMLGGCASAAAVPPSWPTIKQIAERGAEYRLAAPSMSPTEYLQTGIGMVRDGCLGYFDQLAQAQDRLLFASREGSLLGSVGMGAAVATGAGIPALAMLGLATAAAQGTIANAQVSSAAGIYPEETASLIMDKAMASYLAALPVPQTIAEADMYVHGLAALCSTTKIRQLPKDAIATAQTVAIAPAQPAPVSVAPPPELVPPPAEPPIQRPRKRSAVHHHPGTLTPPSVPPQPRAYPPSLLRQWDDVTRRGRAAVERRMPPTIVIAPR